MTDIPFFQQKSVPLVKTNNNQLYFTPSDNIPVAYSRPAVTEHRLCCSTGHTKIYLVA